MHTAPVERELAPIRFYLPLMLAADGSAAEYALVE